MAEVRATRVKTAGQFFELRVPGDGRVWHTRQFAFKERRNQTVLIPYWYEPGKTWHVWAGREKTETPPLASFATMAEAKAYVGGLVDGEEAGA